MQEGTIIYTSKESIDEGVLTSWKRVTGVRHNVHERHLGQSAQRAANWWWILEKEAINIVKDLISLQLFSLF